MIILRRFGSPAHWETGCRRVLSGRILGIASAIDCSRRAEIQNAGEWAGVSRPMRRVLLAVLLDARRAQAGQAVLVDRMLPGQKFFDRQRIAGASFFE